MRNQISFTEQILNTLQDSAQFTTELMYCFMADQHTSRKRFLQWDPLKPKFFTENRWADLYCERKNFYTLLNKLKHDGLVEKKKKGTKSIWKITATGRKKLRNIQKKSPLPLHTNYPTKKIQGITLVIFDIPERERKKRGWLRFALKEMDFRFLQKSVWIGRVALPEEFLQDLRKQNLLRCVHIFSVRKSGSLHSNLE